MFLAVIGISSCTNDDFIEPLTETTNSEIVHEKLTYEQVSKRMDEKLNFDKRLKHSFQENYISSTKDLVKITNTDEEESEILIDYFFDPIHDNETYSFITHEFSGEGDYLEKFVLTVEEGEEKVALLRYYPTTDFSAPLFSGKIEVSTLDRSYVGESYIENGVTITKQSTEYQTSSVGCYSVISIKSSRCTNGGKHPYGVRCTGPGAINDAYLYVTSTILCDFTFESGGQLPISTKILEPNPGSGGGGDGSNIVYEQFYQQLSPTFQNWLKTQPNAKNHLLAYLLCHRNSTYHENIAEDLIEFLANDDYLKTNFNPLTELVIKEALNGNKFSTTEFINFWSNLTPAQKNIFQQYANTNKQYLNGAIRLKPEAEAFLSWAFPYLIDNPTVTVEQFKNWFMGKTEGKDFFYNANYWENPNLTFQQQSLPTWAAFSAAYPNQTSQQLYGIVGGDVAQVQNDYPQETQNGCALKVSVALIGAGKTIPNIPGETVRGKMNANGTYNYYFLNAKALIIWMQKTFGTASPIYIHKDLDDYQGDENQYGNGFKNEILGKKGIFAMLPIDPGPQSQGGFGASGHCDKFDGVECKAGCYFQDALEIFFWELPLN